MTTTVSTKQASEHQPSVTTDMDTAIPQKTPSLALYQSERLAACAKRLIHSFTGKPLSLGGAALDSDARKRHRNELSEILELPKDSIRVPDQVHSATSKTETESDLSACDALIVDRPDHPVMVLTADCVSLIVYDPKRHVGAVIHAGWRGAAQGITPKAIQTLIDNYQCDVKDIIVAIGPSIAACCYEVSQEVVDALAYTLPKERMPEWYFPSEENGRNPRVDLKTVNKIQLEAIGISQIDVLPQCTGCETGQLFSHRRGDTGRQGALLMLKE